MQAISFNIALAQKENTSFPTCKDQRERTHNIYPRYNSYQ